MTRARLLLAVLLGGLFLFSLYGVMSSAEPTGDAPLHTGWFAFYCLLGLGSLLGGAWLCRPSEPDEDEEDEPEDELLSETDSPEQEFPENKDRKRD